MKKFFTLLFVATFGVMAYAQDVAEIKFVTEEIDYGTIVAGADGKRVFEFTNTGKAPLVISNVSSSCGCTVPSWTKDPVAPGAKGTIEVVYDTKRVGPIRKSITVVSNAKDNEQKTLRIKGTVEAKQ